MECFIAQICQRNDFCENANPGPSIFNIFSMIDLTETGGGNKEKSNYKKRPAYVTGLREYLFFMAAKPFHYELK